MRPRLAVAPILWWLGLLLATPGFAGSFNRIPSSDAVAAPAGADAASSAAGSAGAAASEGAAPTEEPPAVAPPAAPDEAAAAVAAPRAPSEEVIAEPDAQPAGEPTYGGACVYGPRGVLYAPAGKDCTRASPVPGSVQAADTPREGTASCVFGLHGELLHAPPGVRCARLREPSPAPPVARPRIRRYRP